MIKVPTYAQLMNPTLHALRALGGSATIEEIYSRVTELVGLTNEQLEVLHDPERGGQTEVEYRLAWSRTYLKKYGILENSSRGIWALTAKGRQLEQVDVSTVKRYVDGDQLLTKLKELSLGVQTKKVEIEQVVLDASWFATI